MTKPSILIVGDAVATTGYGRVLRSIFEPLKNSFQLAHLATRFDGGIHDYPWPLIPASDGGDPYGWRRLPNVVNDLQPDIVFVLYDLGYQARYVSRIEAARCQTRTVVYSPIEGGPIEREILEPLAQVARYVVFTTAARSIIEQSLEDIRRSGHQIPFPTLDVIPHGVDTNLFHPLGPNDRSARKAARSELEIDTSNEIFVVLNANRNLPKKRLDITVEGFAEFSRGRPGAKLLIHSSLQGSGWNLPMLARRHGVTDRLMFSTTDGSEPAASNAELNAIYNASDVGVNTATSEGWGLISFEHAATRSAQILPDTDCLRSLWGDAATFLPQHARMTYASDLTTGVIVSPTDLAASLSKLHDNETARLQMAERAFKRALDPELRWPAIADRWHALFYDVLANPA